jgi:hypothetical protein
VARDFGLVSVILFDCLVIHVGKRDKLENYQLITALAPLQYHPFPLTAGLWQHKTCDITFCLVVDNFGVKDTS